MAKKENKRLSRADINKSAEPIVIFILILITVIEFLIYGAGVSKGDYIQALNAMITLLNFGALLIIVALLLRILDRIKS